MVKAPHLKIVHLYHRYMNIYGDTGNVLTLCYRLQKRGIKAEVIKVEIGEELPADTDILVAGGGQDAGQIVVEKDLHTRQRFLKSMTEDGVIMLVICGTFQLFGHRFITSDHTVIKGIGIFDAETKGAEKRLIGNTLIDSLFGELVGFENHSGRTFLGSGQSALGKVIKGGGNNGSTGEEGAVYRNCFGSYLHGPLLPKNPVFADELIRRALERKYGTSGTLSPLDDAIERAAAIVAKRRPR